MKTCRAMSSCFSLETLDIVARQALMLTVDAMKHDEALICVFPLTFYIILWDYKLLLRSVWKHLEQAFFEQAHLETLLVVKQKRKKTTQWNFINPTEYHEDVFQGSPHQVPVKRQQLMEHTKMYETAHITQVRRPKEGRIEQRVHVEKDST